MGRGGALFKWRPYIDPDMNARVVSIALVVKNKAEALEFYTEKVGFEKKTDYTNSGYRYVTVGPKGQDLELALWEEGSPNLGGSSSQLKAGMYPAIVMRVDDVRRVSAELKARGVQFKQEPQEYSWGVSATFTDPDGNWFSINQLPQWGGK
jgi:catechol 2,3-dioxygenase-like lactoylglutathione lyase family enzyme